MGQYFKIVNLTKKEYINPNNLDSGVKIWEIAANNVPRVLAYLLFQSQDPSGIGKWLEGPLKEDQKCDCEKWHPEEKDHRTRPGRPHYTTQGRANAGRWKGDRITIVGDYDTSKLYQKAERFKEISEEIRDEFNDWIENEEMKVGYPSNDPRKTKETQTHLSPDLVLSASKELGKIDVQHNPKR